MTHWSYINLFSTNSTNAWKLFSSQKFQNNTWYSINSRVCFGQWNPRYNMWLHRYNPYVTLDKLLLVVWINSEFCLAEMRPQWFEEESLPFSQMWPDDKLGFPLFLDGKKFSGYFLFEGHDKIIKYDLEEVNSLTYWWLLYGVSLMKVLTTILYLDAVVSLPCIVCSNVTLFYM